MLLLPNFLAKRPVVAEHDFAGVIADANGSEFTNGEVVFGYVSRRACFLTTFTTLMFISPQN